MTDEETMNKVRSGDVRVLAVLFERHHVKVYNYFLRLTGNGEASEDLTQEVFFRILKYRASYRRDNKFTTWMYRIARNIYIDQLKKKPQEVPLEETRHQEPAPAPLPEQQTTAEQEAALLHRALALLPPGKREVVVLSRFQEMKYRDISRVLDCSIASVKVQVHRAVKELRQIYMNLKLDGGAV